MKGINMTDVQDLINSIGQDNKSGSADLFKDVMATKMLAAIDAKRVEVASSIYAKEEIKDEDV